jgi:hypothetical protein
MARVSPLACSHVIPNGTYFSPLTALERERSQNEQAGAVDSEMTDDM